jgi:hypothetical protein
MLSTTTNKDVTNQAPNFENAPTELNLRFNDKETEILPDIIDEESDQILDIDNNLVTF